MAAGFYRKDQLLADSRPPFPNPRRGGQNGVRLADQPNIAGSQHSDGKNGAAQGAGHCVLGCDRSIASEPG
jgi:hypothetical protein